MNTPANFFRFVLLKNSLLDNALSFDHKIPFSVLFESVEFHLFSAYNLLALLPEFESYSPNTIPAAAVISTWLSDDINSQLQQFNARASQLEGEGK